MRRFEFCPARSERRALRSPCSTSHAAGSTVNPERRHGLPVLLSHHARPLPGENTHQLPRTKFLTEMCNVDRGDALARARHRSFERSWVGLALVLVVFALLQGRGQAQTTERRYYFCLGGALEGFACQGLADAETCGTGAWPRWRAASLRVLPRRQLLNARLTLVGDFVHLLPVSFREMYRRHVRRCLRQRVPLTKGRVRRRQHKDRRRCVLRAIYRVHLHFSSHISPLD